MTFWYVVKEKLFILLLTHMYLLNIKTCFFFFKYIFKLLQNKHMQVQKYIYKIHIEI